MIQTKDIRRGMYHLKSTQAVLTAIILVSGSLVYGGIAQAASRSINSSGTSSADQQRVQNIISKGDQEIARRLTTLNALTNKINAATHLSASDKSTLSGEVSGAIGGLQTLKTQLDADTTVTAAHNDAESIYTEDRVYALVAPKIGLIKVADDQQVVQSKLTALSAKLQTRITTAQQAGKNVATLQNELTDMNNQVTAANKISTTIESSVISLQPSDYNSNHNVLSGDNAQLKTAHVDDQAAYADAKSIVSTLKTL